VDEAAVDLQLVEREALQIAERRIAGAEIVERDAHPERAQACSSFNVASLPSRKIDSVISISSRPARARCRPSACRIVSCSPPRWNWTGETLTATRTCSGQRAAWRQASRITQAPIGTISPVSSAIGMNSPARSGRASGDSSAAAPRTSRCGCLEVEQRLVSSSNSPRSSARRRSVSSWRRSCARWLRLSSKKAKVPRPASLARYSARSAFLQQASRRRAVERRDGDADAGRRARARCRRSLSGRRSLRSCRGRAGRSRCGRRRRSADDELVAAEPGDEMPRARLADALAGSISKASPAGWPSVSLMTLNWSRSRQCSANSALAARATRGRDARAAAGTSCGWAGRSARR
jgi:hypothetical protein